MAQIQQFAPINYAGMQPIQDPSAGFMRGLQMVQAFQQMDADAEARKLQVAKMAAETAKAQAEAERRAAYQADVAAAAKNPTYEAYSDLTTKYPEHREAFGDAYKLRSEGQRKTEFLAGARAWTALENGDTAAAEAVVNEYITPMKNSGKDTGSLEAIREAIKTDPIKAKARLGFVMSAIDPTEWAKIGAEKRAAELAPSKLAESEATATIKGIEAQFAPDKMAEDLKKQRADLVKTMADTELTNANRKAKLAEIAALDSKAKMLAEGKIPLEERPAMEDKFRAEYLKSSAAMLSTRDAFRKVQTASENAIGDLALVIAFNKMIDEGSVVKESEAETVRNAKSLSERLGATFEKIKSGETLTDDQRKNIRNETAKLMAAMERNEKEVRVGLTDIANRRGLDKRNIFYDPSGRESRAAENENTAGKTGDVPPAVPKVWRIENGVAVPSTTSTEGVKRVKGDR